MEKCVVRLNVFHKTQIMPHNFRIAQLCFSLQPGYYSSRTAPNLQHTANQERNDQCGNSTA